MLLKNNLLSEKTSQDRQCFVLELLYMLCLMLIDLLVLPYWIAIFCEFLQEAEMRVRDMEEEMYRLHKSLDERNGQYQEAASSAQKVYFGDLLPIYFLCTS